MRVKITEDRSRDGEYQIPGVECGWTRDGETRLRCQWRCGVLLWVLYKDQKRERERVI
jgi:uncharacterized C2H2 Zn-finger protein